MSDNPQQTAQPDEPGRALEKKLQKRIRKANALLLADVIDEFPAVSEAAYARYQSNLEESLQSEMMTAAMLTAQEYADYFDANESEIMLALMAYLQERVSSVAGGAAATTRKIIERAAAMPGAADWSPSTIEAIVGHRLGSDNAELIAATEITAAISWARLHIIEIMLAAGIRAILIWRTERDERVCDTCRPRDGLSQRDWAAYGITGPPPAHPRCRCRVEIAIP